MNEAEKRHFIATTFIQLIQEASPETVPRWGRMGFQQMVEHMVIIFKNANGKLRTDTIITAPEKLAALKEFIHSDKAFKENTRSPALPEAPQPLHFASLQLAIDKLEAEIKLFFSVYDADENLLIRNPVFGDLNYADALQLLYKHTQHHARQFGLIA